MSARAGLRQKAADSELLLLCVEVATHRCALPVDVVVEIHPAAQLAPLPDAPEVVLGLVNRRGTPVAVLDLRRRLGLSTRPLRVTDRFVVVLTPDRPVALVVDAALDVITVPASAVDAAVARATEAVRSSGVVVLPDGLVVVLDITTFLSTAESAALDHALDSVTPASA